MPAAVNAGLMASVNKHRACQQCTEQAAQEVNLSVSLCIKQREYYRLYVSEMSNITVHLLTELAPL